MALRPAADTPTDNETLGSAHSQRVKPDTAEKRWSALIAAAVIVVSMFLPWWLTTYPIRYAVNELVGWQLLGLGLGFGDWASQTGFSAFGNVLWGVLPTLTALVLALLLVVRAVRPYALAARNIALWAIFALLWQLWLVVLAWLRLDITLGEFGTLWGMLPTTMAVAYSTVTLLSWWQRGERELWSAKRPGKGAEIGVGEGLSELFGDSDAKKATTPSVVAEARSGGELGTGSAEQNDTDSGARDEDAPNSR